MFQMSTLLMSTLINEKATRHATLWQSKHCMRCQ